MFLLKIRLVIKALCCLGSLEVEAKILETKHVEEILPLIDEDTWFSEASFLLNCNVERPVSIA